jgi:hypothetical protein
MKTVIEKYANDPAAFIPTKQEKPTSWCGRDCDLCQNYHCKMMRARATRALDELIERRLDLIGENVASLPIPIEAKRFVVRFVKLSSTYTELTQGEEAILRGVHRTTLARKKI